MKLHQKISLILFGLFLTIVILEIGLRIGGLAILSIQEYRNLQSIKQKGSFRIMCLGESTTQGQYPPFLEEILNKSNIGIKFSVIDKGIRATNTKTILSQLESNLDNYQPDMVITMMGINDYGPHIPYEAASTSKIVLTLRSFKVYKLARLLWLHIVTKCKEKVCYASVGNNQNIRILPKHVSGYNSREVHKQQGFSQEEQVLKKAIELHPNNASVYERLGEVYKEYGKYTEAEQALKKAIELDPNDFTPYEVLAWVYRLQRKDAESEQTFEKVIELNPNIVFAYQILGNLYNEHGKYAEAEQALKKAIELNPNNKHPYEVLAWFYRDQKKFAEAEQALKKAIELDPNDFTPYEILAWFYRSQRKYAESEQAFKKAIELGPSTTDRLYGNLATLYYDIGNNELSEVYAKKADNIRNEYYNPKIINNYHTLKQILDKRKIKLVCMQYPMRNIESLKDIFKEETEGSIIFVDNEKIFKDAIRKESYNEYFADMFGGDFGHCTDKGNRLLAENIANIILKKYFNK